MDSDSEAANALRTFAPCGDFSPEIIGFCEEVRNQGAVSEGVLARRLALAHVEVICDFLIGGHGQVSIFTLFSPWREGGLVGVFAILDSSG
jgi:hypothetical protein